MAGISERIKYIRKDFLLTQVEFSKRLGVTNAHISKIEKGITTPSEALIKLICEVFDVNEQWLKHGEEPIYLEDLEDEADINLTQSTKALNKLLTYKNPIIRLKTSQIEKSIGNILSVDDFNDDEKILYLNMQIKLMREISDLMDIFKEYVFDKQMLLFSSDIKSIFTYQKGSIDKTLDEIMEFFVKQLNEKSFVKDDE